MTVEATARESTDIDENAEGGVDEAEEPFDPRAEDILTTGTVLAGRYEITKHLAAGGMGRVYVATQAPLGRKVALKVMHRELCQDPESVKRFMREAVAVSQLTHPNTITIFDYGESADGNFFIAMEFLEGEPLGERLERDGALTPDEAVGITVQVARSLSEAHRKNIVHRDLKPDNIFIGTVEKDLVKVLDFGIAKILVDAESEGTKLTRMGFVCGTPEYMAPEQARGDELDGRSDIYALGVCLYEMLNGEAPFVESTPLATVLKHQNSAPPPLPDSVPEPLSRFVLERAMAKNADDRPGSAEVFIEELELAAVQSGLSRGDSTGNLPRSEVLANAGVAAAGVASGTSTADHDVVPGAGGSRVYLIAALLILLIGGAVIAYLLTQGGEDEGARAATTQPEASATPAETDPPVDEAPEGPQPVVLEFASEPERAFVYRGGVDPANLLGKTPFSLDMTPEAEEDVDFTFALEGHAELTVTQHLPAARDKEVLIPVRAELVPLVSLTLSAQPEGAALFIDGEAAGFAPQVLSLEAGREYAITLEAEGHEPFEDAVSLSADDTLDVELEPIKTASKTKKRKKKRKKKEEKDPPKEKDEPKEEEKKPTGYEAFGD